MLQSIPTTFEFDTMSIVNPRIKSSTTDGEEEIEKLQSSPINANKNQSNEGNDTLPEPNKPFIIISNDSFDDSHGDNYNLLDKTIDRIMEINEKNSLEDIKHFKEIITDTNNNNLPIFDNYDYEIDSAEFFDDICGNSFSDSEYETENDKARLEFRNPELSDENLITSSSSDRGSNYNSSSSSKGSSSSINSSIASDSGNESGSDDSTKQIDNETIQIYEELERLFTTRDEQVVKDTIELLKSQILPKLNILKDDANKYHELKKIFRLPSVTNLALLSNQYKKNNKKRYDIDMENELFNDEFVFHTITKKDKLNSKIQFKNEFDEFKRKNNTRANKDVKSNSESIPKKSKKQSLPESEVQPIVKSKSTTLSAKKQKKKPVKISRRHSSKIPNLDTLGEDDDEFSIHDGITNGDGCKEIARAISIVKPQEKVLIVKSKSSDGSLNSFNNLENQVKELRIGEKSKEHNNSSSSSDPSSDHDTNFLQVSPTDASQIDDHKYFKEFDGNFGEELATQFNTGVKLIEISIAKKPTPVVQTVKSVKSYEAVATIESDVTAETVETTNETIVGHNQTFVGGLENDAETIFSSNETIYNGSSIMSQETVDDDDSTMETLTIILESNFAHAPTPRQQTSYGSFTSSISPVASNISASSTSSTSNTSVSTDTVPAPNYKSVGQDMYYSKPLPIPAAAPTTVTAAAVLYMSPNSARSRPNSPEKVRSLMKPFVSSTANSIKINPTIGSSSAPSSSPLPSSNSHPYAPHRPITTRSRSGSHATIIHNRNNSMANSPEIRNYSKRHDRNKDKRRIFALTRKELDELRCELAYNFLPELNSANTNSNNHNESKSIKPIVSFFENFKSKNNNTDNNKNSATRFSLGSRKNEFDLDSNSYNIFKKPRFYESPICQLTNNQIEICIGYTLSRTLSSSYRF